MGLPGLTRYRQCPPESLGVSAIFLGRYPKSQPTRVSLSYPADSGIQPLRHGPLQGVGEVRLDTHTQGPPLATLMKDFERMSERAFQQALGDFSGGFWDRHSGILTCFRDPIGCKSLYYYDGPEFFVFSNCMQKLMSVAGVPRIWDEEAVVFSCCNLVGALGERSYFRNIRRLTPGTVLRVTPAGLTRRTYWQPELRPTLRESQAELAERVRWTLEQAVRARTPATGVGGHISGGLDSSAVCVLASRQVAQPLPVFSWSPPPDGRDDESALVQLLCREANLLPHFCPPTTEHVLSVLERPPELGPRAALFHSTASAARAQSQGVKVMLTGWGGDETLSHQGGGHLLQLLLEGRWRLFWSELREGSTPWWRYLVGQLVLPWIPRSWLKFIGKGAFAPVRSLERRGWLEQVEALSPHFSTAIRLLETRSPGRLPARSRQLLALKNGHLSWRAEAWSAHGRRFGIDYRYPFLDRRVIELSLALPVEAYQYRGWGRSIFRQAMAGILPDPVRWNRGKYDAAAAETKERALLEAWENLKARIANGESHLDHLLNRYSMTVGSLLARVNQQEPPPLRQWARPVDG